VLFVGDDELHVLGESGDLEASAAALGAAGVGEVVVKRGAAGSMALVDGAVHRAGATPVHIVDVIGAGDSFVAGYLAARCEALSVDERLAWGARAAAFTIGSSGDWEGLPTRTELLQHDPSPRTCR
jgi:2-dehydro-3-deoxygluconokinase